MSEDRQSPNASFPAQSAPPTAPPLWRQGDVLIQAIERLPRGAVKRDDRVIAEGAVTGHRHELAPGGDAALFELDGEVFLRVFGKRARVVHAEHGAVKLETGCYRVWRQREYTEHGEFRSVLD